MIMGQHGSSPQGINHAGAANSVRRHFVFGMAVVNQNIMHEVICFHKYFE
jgi:hypothetical protein